MNTFFRTMLSLNVLILIAAVAFGGEEQNVATCSACRKILVFDHGTKPTVALRNPKYELRCSGCRQGDDKKTTCSDCSKEKQCDFCKQANVHDPLMCETCLRKRNPNPSEKPSVTALNRNIAFLCEVCQNLCWRDDGKEQKFEGKQDCDACEELKKALTQANEPVCPHCAAHNKPLDTGTKATANQNIRRPCPECEKSMDGKVCKTCEGSKTKCAICTAAILDKQKQAQAESANPKPEVKTEEGKANRESDKTK